MTAQNYKDVCQHTDKNGESASVPFYSIGDEILGWQCRFCLACTSIMGICKSCGGEKRRLRHNVSGGKHAGWYCDKECETAYRDKRKAQRQAELKKLKEDIK